MNYPGVGVAVYIRKEGKILLGKRTSEHGRGEWCPPGGKLEMNESLEDCARRETLEETGLKVKDLTLIGVTNDIWTDIGTHYVTVSYAADWAGGEAKVMEPEKCERWEWFAWGKFPEPLFLSTANFIKSDYNLFV